MTLSKTLPLFLVLGSMAFAQKTPPKPAAVIASQWSDVHKKVLAMAKDFPEDKYDYKPHKDSRTFAHQVLHVTEGARFAIQLAKGESPKWTDLKREDFKTKAAIVNALQAAITDAEAAMKSAGDKVMDKFGDWIGLIEHGAEHYGQLVVYYRANGLVPPESRKK